MRTLPALCLLITATLLPAISVTASTAVTGQAAPDFALRSASGEKLRLSEWRGEIVLLTFWAEWCGRCSDQLAELQKIQERYAGRGVRVVAVSIDRDLHHAPAATTQLTLLHDSDQSVARQYALSSLPLTVLVDAHGAVRHVHEKYRGGDAALYDEELAALLKE